MLEVELINRDLKRIYGTDLTGLRPKYRLVWSSDQMEKRFGHYEDWYGGYGCIFIREFVGVREAKKYTHLKDQWVLEKLVFDPNPELIGSRNGHYEPLWAFPQGLPPILKACRYVIHRDLNRNRNKLVIMNEAWDQWEKDKEEDKQLILDYWEEDMSYLQRMLSIDEGVSYGGVKPMEGTVIGG